MIFLTSDIHHRSLGTGNQKHADQLESELAVEFYRLARKRGIKLTYFISGRCFVEDWEVLAPILEDHELEIGGHNFSCFEPSLLHRISKKLCRSYPGPRWYERREIQKTIDIIEEKCGRRIKSWRDHMYLGGPNTDRLLLEQGIRICSDQVDKDAQSIRHAEGRASQLAINIIPDHEHLYHAERTKEWVERWRKRYAWTDSFGPESYFIEEWTELVIQQIEAKQRAGTYACLIIHPITMYLCDKFRSAERILDVIARYPTRRVSDALGAPDAI